MWNQKLSKEALLSSLWVFVMINFFARGLHELGRTGMLEQMMSGEIDGVVITEELMLFAGVMFEIPILMENLNPDLDNIFFMVMQIGVLLVAFRVAWKWNEEG